KVAVPLEKHSWMFGQDASSHTVTSAFARNFAFNCCTALPCGRRTRIHEGLRKVGDASNVARSPASFSPVTIAGMRLDWAGRSLMRGRGDPARDPPLWLGPCEAGWVRRLAV